MGSQSADAGRASGRLPPLPLALEATPISERANPWTCRRIKDPKYSLRACHWPQASMSWTVPPWLANLPSRPRGGVVGSCWVGQASTDIRVYALGRRGNCERASGWLFCCGRRLYIGRLAVECNRASPSHHLETFQTALLYFSFLWGLFAFPFCLSRSKRFFLGLLFSFWE